MKILLPLLALWCVPMPAVAQQPTPSPSKAFSQRRCCVRRLPKRTQPATTTAAPQPTPGTSPDFFVGEARVDVTKDDTVVRLAMAQHGSVFIELPANDGPRYIIPGDPEMATVDEKALEKNKRAIIVRPGSLFLPPLPKTRARTPAATVTVQMRSGLVVTFLFYPVENLAQNVHRCVLNYRRDEVVARRRAAGLPVNLDDKEQGGKKTTEQSAAPTSISVETAEESQPPTKQSSATPQDPLPPEMGFKLELHDTSPLFNLTSEISDSNTTKKGNKTFAKALLSARKLLKQAIKAPGQFKDWTKPVHGLALSVVRKQPDTEGFRLMILAVRNMTTDILKLTPGTPDLFVEMLDDQKKPVNVESIKKLYTEVSDVTGVISAGGTLYYAIAYIPPILGVNQQVCVAVSQTNAADEPALVKLANGKR